MLTKNFYNAVMAYITGKAVTNGMRLTDGTYKDMYPQASGVKILNSICYIASNSTSNATMFGTAFPVI